MPTYLFHIARTVLEGDRHVTKQREIEIVAPGVNEASEHIGHNYPDALIVGWRRVMDDKPPETEDEGDEHDQEESDNGN